MIVIGVILAVVALVIVGFMLFGTRDLGPIDVDLGVLTAQLTPMHLYLLGAATLIIFVLGLFFLSLGLRAQRRHRREVKELRAAVRDGSGDPQPPERYGRGDTGHDAGRDSGHRRSHDPAPAPYEREVPDARATTPPPPSGAPESVASDPGTRDEAAPSGADHGIAIPGDHRGEHDARPDSGNQRP